MSCLRLKALINTKSAMKHIKMYIIISMQEIKPKTNQLQHPPLSPLACLLTVLSVTVRGGFPPLLQPCTEAVHGTGARLPLLAPPSCDLGFLSMCESSNFFASCKKSSSMLFELLAEVSRKGMSFSCANCRPCSCVISLFVRSLLFPAGKSTVFESKHKYGNCRAITTMDCTVRGECLLI